jgi:hypothetical protein
MKKIFLLFILLYACLSGFSQLDKGIWLAGGSGSFYSYKETTDDATRNQVFKYTDIQLSANIGYFILDKLALGISPSFSFNHGKEIGRAVYIVAPTILAIGPFVRYYFLNTEKEFNLLADTRFTIGTIRAPSPSYYHKGNQYKFSIMAGPELFLNSSIGLELLIGYYSMKEKIYTDTRHSTTNSGFKATIGIQLHLEKL